MYPGVELRLLRYVVAVAETLNFGRAAQRLNTSQPSLSKQILQLEHYLGYKLFRRSKRWVEITPAGRRFIDDARKALHYAERAAERGRVADQEEHETVIVGYAAFVDLNFVSVLRRLEVLSNQVPTLFKSSNTSEVVSKLISHEWHAGLVLLPVIEDELTAIPLMKEPIVVAVPESHRLASKREVSLRDLRDATLILPPRRFNPHFHDYLIARFKHAGFAPRAIQEPTSPHEALHLVADNIGVALAPGSVLRNHRKGLVLRELAEREFFAQSGLAFHRDNEMAHLKAFVDAVLRARDQYVARTKHPMPISA